MNLPTLSEIYTAVPLVRQHLLPTAQIKWPLLEQQIGTEVWVRHENHLPTGAFKVRGGLVYLHELKQAEPDVKGVISATRGNHGQSIAFAAAQQGLSAMIVVPHGNSKEKNAAMRAYGAELIEYGNDFDDAAGHARDLSEQHDLHMIPSFHPALIKGVASYWLELFSAVPDLDVVYAPLGLGSGICAGITVRDGLNLTTEIIPVISSAAPTYALSYAEHQVVEHPTTTAIADGVAVRKADQTALQIILKSTRRIVQVDDADIKAAMRLYFRATHNIAEGAGAAPLTALAQEKTTMAGKKVALILSGGNVDSEIFASVLNDTKEL